VSVTGLARMLPLGDYLARRGIITREQQDEALRLHGTSGRRLGEILVEMGAAEESDIAPAGSVALASRIVSASGPEEAGVERYWRWLLLGALGVLLVEWWIYNRRAFL